MSKRTFDFSTGFVQPLNNKKSKDLDSDDDSSPEQDENCENSLGLNMDEKKALDTLGKVDIKSIMNGDGPNVKCVLLKADGPSSELELDMTPRLKTPQTTLGGPITFLGQWESIGAILLVNAELVKKKQIANEHKLQPPFHETNTFGDILVTRTGDEGEPLDITLDEYNMFCKQEIAPWVPDALDGESESEEDDHEEDEEEVGDNDVVYDEGEPGEDEEEEKEMIEEFKKQLLEGFKNLHGREPNEEEAASIFERLEKSILNAKETGEEDEEGEEE